MLLKIGQMEKEILYISEEKKTKQCYHNDNCSLKMDSFPVKLKLKAEMFE